MLNFKCDAHVVPSKYTCIHTSQEIPTVAANLEFHAKLYPHQPPLIYTLCFFESTEPYFYAKGSTFLWKWIWPASPPKVDSFVPKESSLLLCRKTLRHQALRALCQNLIFFESEYGDLNNLLIIGLNWVVLSRFWVVFESFFQFIQFISI